MDAEKQCKIWNAIPVENEIVKWSGPCIAGFADGEGTVTNQLGNKRQMITTSFHKGQEIDGPKTVVAAPYRASRKMESGRGDLSKNILT
jgi:hypothetical protein